MPTDLTQLGMAAAVVLIIIREVFSFIKSFFGQDKIDRILGMTTELYKMHDVKNGNGKPVWYMDNDLSSAVKKLADNVSSQNIVLGKLIDYMSRLEISNEKQNEKLDKIIIKRDN